MIKFGTDGWRAEIARDFTFDNVRTAALAFAAAYSGQAGPVVIGYDNRFLSFEFASCAAEAIAEAGLQVLLCDRSCPTPAVSFHVVLNKAAAGVMITASHNPPQWNGFKIKEPYGGSARLDTTKKVESLLGSDPSGSKETGKISTFDPRLDYLKKVRSFVDLELIASSGIKLICDPMHGSGSGYLRAALDGSAEVIELNSGIDPTFGGINPEPIEKNLPLLKKTCRQTRLSGIALDGDADRLAACGSGGAFINTHQVYALLLYHLVENKKMSGSIVKTFNLSRLIDRMADRYGLKVFETPIGFKYIADLMMKEDILMGGEESGGMGIKGYLPERDGVLAAMLLTELMAVKKKPLDRILDDISKEFGLFFYDRLDLQLEEEKKQRLVGLLEKSPPAELATSKVKEVRRLDGTKLIFGDGSWILFRASGTEPLLRIYCEADAAPKVAGLIEAGRSFCLNG